MHHLLCGGRREKQPRDLLTISQIMNAVLYRPAIIYSLYNASDWSTKFVSLTGSTSNATPLLVDPATCPARTPTPSPKDIEVLQWQSGGAICTHLRPVWSPYPLPTAPVFAGVVLLAFADFRTLWACLAVQCKDTLRLLSAR